MAQLDIQRTRQSDPGQLPRPGLEGVDPAAHMGVSGERADGNTEDDVGLNPDASGVQGTTPRDYCDRRWWPR
jgi:hypothetical protein